jgi:uncharacterized protein
VKLLARISQNRPNKGVRVLAVEEDLRAELVDLRFRLPAITGALVASTDGMLIVHEANGLQAETLAAMAAAQLGLGRQFAATAALGGFQEAVTRTDAGCLAVFAAGNDALLTVFATAELNLGRLYHEARPVAVRVGALLGG